MENIEKVYIIQPKLNENYRALHDEAVALIESAGAAYCGSTYQTIKKSIPQPISARANSHTFASF